MVSYLNKLLLCNGAHLGDLILATSVLPVLRAAFPNIEIGFLTGSWSKEVVNQHSYIDYVHFFDHSRLNRSSCSVRKKKWIANQTWFQAVRELKEKKYDVAIDLYYFYSANSGALLAHAGVPKRVCFWASPSHYHFNYPLFWQHQLLHMVENHGMMLRKLGVDERHLSLLKPCLKYRNNCGSPVTIPQEFFKEGYLVIHPGVGCPLREWPLSSWKELCKYLNTINYPCVFVGKGEKENCVCSELQKNIQKSINLTNKLSWRQVVDLIQRARLLIGLESMAGHIAAACGTPAVLIYEKLENSTYWRPFHKCCRVIAHPRAPNQKISPIRAVDPDQVFSVIKEILEKVNC